MANEKNQQTEIKPTEEKPAEWLVITDRHLPRGTVSVNGVPYEFTKGQQKRVPAQVKDLLVDAGYCVSAVEAR